MTLHLRSRVVDFDFGNVVSY
uniref:Uncharacterized protein n=1 Tax=Arabidopsis thaliana TaxID=3702 RepID=Q56Z55_ARATH|nr:hypothetical protein [Arabidopsis thaliana]